MTEIDTQLLVELDRAYPPPVTEADWSEVLRRIEPAPAPRERGVRRLATVAAMATIAFVVVAALVLGAPWAGHASFTERALAAVGQERYVHIVVTPEEAPYAGVVDLGTGHERPAVLKTVYWYDSTSGEYFTWSYVDGVLVGSDDVLPGTGMAQPGLIAFLSGYRNALANGMATVVGATTVEGKKAKILRFDASRNFSSVSGAGFHASYGEVIPGETEDVAVDDSTHQPLWYRFNSASPNGAHQQWPINRILSIASATNDSAQPRLVAGFLGESKPIRAVNPEGATAALGQVALWPGETIGGLRLRSIHLERVTTSLSPYFTPAIRSGRGLHFVYGSAPDGVDITEAATPQGGYRFDSATLGAEGPLAPTGSMRLACDGCGITNQPVRLSPEWLGQLRQGGLYITISGPSRGIVLEAARALTALP
jgi:hypothetical protein